MHIKQDCQCHQKPLLIVPRLLFFLSISHVWVMLIFKSQRINQGQFFSNGKGRPLKPLKTKVIHKKARSDNQRAFIQFTFDIFGFLVPEFVDILPKVQKIMHINVEISRSTDVVFKRIGLVDYEFVCCLAPTSLINM